MVGRDSDQLFAVDWDQGAIMSPHRISGEWGLGSTEEHGTKVFRYDGEPVVLQPGVYLIEHSKYGSLVFSYTERQSGGISQIFKIAPYSTEYLRFSITTKGEISQGTEDYNV
jgi:hypothetical protein